MKVTEKNNTPLDGSTKVGSAKGKSRVSSKASGLGNLDKVSGRELGSSKVKLSERAQDMKKIRGVVDSTPDVDEAKVAKYKSMLAKGEYKVDAKAIADKMVDEHAYNEFFNPNSEE
jgi:negative regulator of flagellin synthesis FlgM